MQRNVAFVREKRVKSLDKVYHSTQLTGAIISNMCK